jgi:phage terminase small subunit
MALKRGHVRKVSATVLTPMQSRIVDEYLKDLDISATAQRAGVSYQTTYNALHLAKVKAEVLRRQRERAERSAIDGDRVLVELARIGFSDIGDVMDWKTVKRPKKGGGFTEETIVRIKDLKSLTPAARAAIAEIKPTKYGLHVKFHNKQAALDSMAKHLGLYSDEVKLTIPVQFIVERSGDRRHD